METIKVKKPSVPVMRKLRKGEPATLTKGDDFEVLVSANMAKKIKKAHDKGKGIRVKLETDAISEMEGKGVWGWLKRTTSRAVRGIESVAEPVAKIGGEATKLITGSSQIGKAAEATGRFLLGKDELAGAAGALGGIGGSELGAAAAVAAGQPELAPIGGIIGGVIGSAVSKAGTKELEKMGRPKRISKLTPEQAQAKLDKAQKAEEAKKEKERKKQEKERKKKEKEDEKQRKKQEAEMRKQAMKPYKGRDTSGRLKTFKTLTGATPDPVPVETMFQGTGSKKGSAEMKEKMAKLRAMRKKKTSGEGLVAEGSGEGITMEMEGTGKAYTKEEWTEKLCEGENSLIEQKKKKIDEREAKKAAKKAPAKKAPAPAKEATAKSTDTAEEAAARDFVNNFKPKRYTDKYKREFNKNVRILQRPLQKEQDEIYEKLEKDILKGSRFADDARGRFDDIVRRATPYNEAQTIWVINKERVDAPLLKRYRELQDEIDSFGMYNMSGEGKQTEKDEEDERLAMKISDMAKKVSKIEKEHEKMTGKGKHDAPTIMPVTNMPVAISEPKPILGQDPATWSPIVSAPRPDFEKGHNVPIRAGRFDGVSGSKLLGRRHQAFSSQPHSSNYGWKHTLGMPR